MTRVELASILKSTGFALAYREFRNPQPPPYIVYMFVEDDDLKADNINYAEISNYQIELYSKEKDSTSEKLIETALKNNSIGYSKHEEYIRSEKLNQVVYLIQISGGN